MDKSLNQTGPDFRQTRLTTNQAENNVTIDNRSAKDTNSNDQRDIGDAIRVDTDNHVKCNGVVHRNGGTMTSQNGHIKKSRVHQEKNGVSKKAL